MRDDNIRPSELSMLGKDGTLHFERLSTFDDLSALWAEAFVDYVEAYGLLLFGNVFGECAVVELTESAGTLAGIFSREHFTQSVLQCDKLVSSTMLSSQSVTD